MSGLLAITATVLFKELLQNLSLIPRLQHTIEILRSCITRLMCHVLCIFTLLQSMSFKLLAAVYK